MDLRWIMIRVFESHHAQIDAVTGGSQTQLIVKLSRISGRLGQPWRFQPNDNETVTHSRIDGEGESDA